jgi:hypothetical protein
LVPRAGEGGGIEETGREGGGVRGEGGGVGGGERGGGGWGCWRWGSVGVLGGGECALGWTICTKPRAKWAKTQVIVPKLFIIHFPALQGGGGGGEGGRGGG